MDYLSSLPGAIAQGLIWGIMAIGVYLTYRILDFADLTVDGSICTGAAVCAVAVVGGLPVWLAIILATIAGMLAGLVTGLFNTMLGIPPILSGILTQLILWSVNLKIMGKANQALPARNYPLLIAQLYPALKNILILVVFVIGLIALLYWFFGTETGSAIRATGTNPSMSRAQGINTNMMKIIGLVISNGFVAMSGALLAQYLGSADINMGKGAIVIGLAAVIIGEAVFGRRVRNFALSLLCVVGGSVVYYIVYQTVIFLGLDTDLLKMLSAIMVALFLAVPYLRTKMKKKPRKAPIVASQTKEGEENDDA